MSRKPYVRQMSKTSWFLTHSRYKSYILHEVTCIFIAIYAVILIVGLFRLGQGPEAWQGWLDGLRSPLGIIFQILAFMAMEAPTSLDPEPIGDLRGHHGPGAARWH